MAIAERELEDLRKRLRTGYQSYDWRESVIRTLARHGVGPTLVALCDGSVSLDKVLTLVTREGLEKILEHACGWVNLYASGDEMITVSSPREPVEDAREEYKDYKDVLDAFELHGIIRIDDHEVDDRSKYEVTLIENGHSGAPANERNEAFHNERAKVGPTAYTCVRFVANGRCALSGSRDFTMTLWDLESGSALRHFVGHTEAVWSIACSEDGVLAVTASGDRTVRLWNVDTGECLRVFEGHADRVRTVVMDAAGTRALSGGFDSSMRLWDLQSGQCLHRYDCYSGSKFSDHVPATLRANRAFTRAPYMQHAIWDLASGKCETLLKFDEYPTIELISEDGRYGLCNHAVNRDGARVSRLCLWDLGGLTLAHAFEPFEGQSDDYSAYPLCLAMSGDGRYAAAGFENGGIYLWELASGRYLRSLASHGAKVNGLAFSADGKQLLSASGAPGVALWNVESGERRLSFGVDSGKKGYADKVPVYAFPGDVPVARTPLEHIPLSSLDDSLSRPTVALMFPQPV